MVQLAPGQNEVKEPGITKSPVLTLLDASAQRTSVPPVELQRLTNLFPSVAKL